MEMTPERVAWLKKRKQELEDRISAIKRDYQQGLSADSSEQAVELENAEVLAEIQRLAVEELRHINEELSKQRVSDEH